MIRRVTFIVMVLAALTALAGAALAVPNLIQYQGRLTDAAGNALTGNFSVRFDIYDALTGGASVYNETQTVSANNGLFNAVIGNANPIGAGVFNGANRFLAITVGTDPEMSPRWQITSVGYSLRAGTAEGLTTSTVASVDGVSNNAGDIDLVAGTGITITPNDAANTITVANSSPTPGVVYHFVGGGNIGAGVTDSLCSIVLNAPAAGFALVQATFESYLNHVAGEFTYMRYQINNSYALASFSAGGNQHFVQSSLPGGSYDAPAACARLFPVAAGANRFFLMGANIIGSGANTWQMVNMSAIYIPTALGVTAVPQEIAGSTPGGTKSRPGAASASTLNPELRP